MLNYDSSRTYPPEKKRKKIRPYLLTLLGILLVFGYFFAVLLLMNHASGSGGGKGTGTSAEAGTGPGNGSHGDGPGRGTGGLSPSSGLKTGPEAGKGKKQEAPKAAEQKAGQKNDSASGSGSAGSAQEGRKARKQEKQPIESLFLPLPVKAAQNQSDGTEKQDSASGGGKAGKKGFYGIHTTGNTIYIVDVSGSMAVGTQEGTRIATLQAQLKTAIRTEYMNDSKSTYCIIPFSNSATVFPAPDVMKRFCDSVDMTVSAFINSMQANGGTNLMEGILLANQIVSQKENKIATIFILTDGAPNIGGGWMEIRNMIRKKFPKKIRINCISIGQKCRDMEELAKEYSGLYSEIL